MPKRTKDRGRQRLPRQLPQGGSVVLALEVIYWPALLHPGTRGRNTSGTTFACLPLNRNNGTSSRIFRTPSRSWLDTPINAGAESSPRHWLGVAGRVWNRFCNAVLSLTIASAHSFCDPSFDFLPALERSAAGYRAIPGKKYARKVSFVKQACYWAVKTFDSSGLTRQMMLYAQVSGGKLV